MTSSASFSMSAVGACLCLLLVSVSVAQRCARQDEVQCIVSPCMLAKCPGFPRANCQPNYCGSCTADFYLNGIQLLAADCQDAGRSASGNNPSSSISRNSIPSMNKFSSFFKDNLPFFGKAFSRGNARDQQTPPMFPAGIDALSGFGNQGQQRSPRFPGVFDVIGSSRTGTGNDRRGQGQGRPGGRRPSSNGQRQSPPRFQGQRPSSSRGQGRGSRRPSFRRNFRNRFGGRN